MKARAKSPPGEPRQAAESRRGEDWIAAPAWMQGADDAPQPEAFHVEAGALATLEDAPPRPLGILDGGELIELSIRPSLWYIPLRAGRVLVVCGLAVALLMLLAPPAVSPAGALGVALAILLSVVRLIHAGLQWASCLYVLTNRRVIHFCGVLSVERTDVPLSRIGAADLRSSVIERPLRLGSIFIRRLDDRPLAIVWESIASPTEVHRKLLQAIQRAQSGD